MAKLIKIRPLDEYAKLDVVKSAAKDALFLVIPKSAIKGRDKDGHIILDKSADVSEDIRKEDMDASGYGQDSGDQMADDDASNWPSKEEAMEHAKNLEKAKGAFMKGQGIDSLADSPSREDDLEQKPGESDDAFKSRKAAFTKSKATVTDLQKRLDDVPALIEAAVARALEGKTGGENQPVPHKGTLVEKTVAQGSGSGTGKDERTLKVERLESLKAERSTFIEKMNAKIALSGEDMMRKTKVAEEIMSLETELMVRR